jgi:hypothetical protein
MEKQSAADSTAVKGRFMKIPPHFTQVSIALFYHSEQ